MSRPVDPPASDERLEALHQWLVDACRLGDVTLTPASSDASFRRYLRVGVAGGRYIAMDAPPEKEDVHPFMAVARLLADAGLNVPRIIEADVERGFLLLTDLGARLYLDELGPETVATLYGDALDALARLQLRTAPTPGALPPYDERRLWDEMALFRDWYLGRHLGLSLDAAQRGVLDEAFGALADAALEQPAVVVHRDYHSRNLMVTEYDNPGILDFQDAVIGPVTYDLVSLLRDCYIAWPRERVEAWALAHRNRLVAAGVLDRAGEAEFMRWFDLMGVQRHLKASGIFARLNHRDGKPGYLADIPRTLRYVDDVAARYEVLQPLHALLGELGVWETVRTA